MKHLLFFIIAFVCIISCKTKNISTVKAQNLVKGDTVKIVNSKLEYEVIIIDGGFTYWLNSRSLARGYYSELFLENKNRAYISEWNRRCIDSKYDPKLYEMQINYDDTVRYGYEVNYLIYNYMIYFQNTYKQQLFGIVPPR